MAYYERSQLEETRARFRRNRNPGSGIVQGLGSLGTVQQVLWQPRYDTHRHDTVFKKDADNSALLHMQVYSRRGNLLTTRIVMDSVSTASHARQVKRIQRMSHFATTSTYGEEIATALKHEATLQQATLDPETDRYHTRGVSGLIVTGPVAAHRLVGKRQSEGSFLLVHQPAHLRPESFHAYHSAPAYDTLDEIMFERGVGVGAHAYEGVGRQPFTDYRYAFPLGSSAENTLDIYTDLLGKRRGVNIAVKEMIGASVIAIEVANASGEAA